MSGTNININPATFQQDVIYKECLHNHAASLGCLAYDGCLEFLRPTIGDAAVDGDSKEAMLCVACHCHRNFHRKEIVYNPITMNTTTAIPQNHHQPDIPRTVAGPSASAEEGLVVLRPTNRKKRTKFTTEQRSRMEGFAERLGWRSQRTNKEEIKKFCIEVGISRRRFVVWLSNNRRGVKQNHTVAAPATV